MAVSMRDLDPAFQGAGQKVGIEIWRIENFHPVPVSPSSHGKFFTGDSYVILKTTSSKNGALRHDIHYWLGKDTSQDEAGTAAFKTVELDASLGGHAVQYREVQGHETEKFLSYFKPCIIPQQGGVASGFKHPETEEHKTRMYICKGKRVVHVKEVPFSRSSLGHDDVFILDTKTKIFQFNGSNSSIQERAKALEVVQYIKDTYHDGKCEVAAIEDGRMMADADTGEFWGLFGGFAPLPRKVVNEDDKVPETSPPKLFCFGKGQLQPVQYESLNRELLATNKCYLLDCGSEIFVWIGRTTSLDERKSASAVAEEMLSDTDRAKTHIIRVIEGFETVIFRSKFDSWSQTANSSVSEEGRSKVAALLLRQKFDRGPTKTASVKEEPQPFLDCTGNLQVWRVNCEEKNLLSSSEQSKFYSGDCYIFQYTYPGEDKEECLIGTWFGKQSIEKDRSSALSLATKMVESSKLRPVQARIYEGKEPVQFFSIFQSFILFKGGLSSGYKYYLKENGITDETYTEDGTALFRIQGSGPEYMQAIQVELVGSSLNSSYCYILQSGSTVFTWAGSLTSPEDQEIVERQLDIIKPNLQPKPLKEGAESQLFWDLLGGKCEHPSLKIKRDVESDPRLFSCTFLKGTLKVHEIFNFSQDDLMTEDVFILDCRSNIFIWIGQQVDSKGRMQSLSIGEKYLEQDFLMEKLSHESPLFIIFEGNEPPFFTRFFNWDPSKALIQGNSFERKLAIVKNGITPSLDKPRRRPPVSGGRSSTMPDKSQRSRSMSFSPDRVRNAGRSPMFQELASKFEKPNTRNLSTPPQVGRGPKIFPKAVIPESAMLAPKSSKIISLTSTFESAKVIQSPSPGVIKENKTKPEVPKLKPQNSDSMSNRIESLTIQEDQKEGEIDDDEGLPIFPYDRLKTTSTDPVADIDVTKRETYLSSEEFREKFGMTKDAFYKLAKWRQNKLKQALLLF